MVVIEKNDGIQSSLWCLYALPTSEFIPEQLVMPSQTQAIRFVQHMLLKQFEEFFRLFGLCINRVQRASNNLPWRIGIPRESFPIERFLFPAVIDAGQDLVLPVAGDHLEENAAAIALEVFAIELDEGVFASGQTGAGRNARHGLEMDAAHFALGDFRQDGMDRVFT